MSEKRQRDFKGIWIPKELYLDENLNWTEKILLVEIDSLDNEDGCYASNKYFADFLSKSKVYISNCISKLKKEGYIYQESFDGRKRVLKSNMRVKLKNKPALNNSLKQDKEKVKGADSARDTKEIGTKGQKKASNNLTNKLINKIEEEEAQNISAKFEKIFNRKLSVELLSKLLKLYKNPKILMKALQVTEEKGDTPSYLLNILTDWKKKGLKTVKQVDNYLKQRQANKGQYKVNKDKKEIKELHNIENLEKKGWNK